MSERNLSGCLKYGCLGCLSLIALGIVLIFLFGAVQMSMDTEPELEQRALSQELPLPPEAAEPPLESYEGAAGAPLSAEGTDMPQRIQVAPPKGRLVLDLSVGDFTIRPGPTGQPIQVEADYDTNAFRLEKSFATRSDGTWVYELGFGPKGGWLGSLLRGGNQSRNKLVLTIPRGQPIELAGKIGVGESETDLGGLWIESADLEIGVGEHFLELSEPTERPIRSFQLDSSIGELEVRRLGNGSPAQLQVEHGIGELFLDLKGAWATDSEIEVDFGIGECKLWLPEGVHIDLDSSRVAIGEKSIDSPDRTPIPPDAPTLALRLQGSIGELSVEY